MKKPFNQASYLAQVRRLRVLALKVLKRYPIKVKSVTFINHAENTTFRITAANRKKFLLRIHRSHYHTKPAILEELMWLQRLARKGLGVPRPIASLNGHFVETMAQADLQGERNCSLLSWTDGKFVTKSVQPAHLYEAGKLIADLQNQTPKTKTQHRRYWTADGLVGSQPKFGSIDRLSGVTPKEQKRITAARKNILRKLKFFEKKYPHRMGLIHADLHFRNIVMTADGPAAIDFDDCGYGFLVYDLAIPYISAQYLITDKKKHLLPEYRKALIAGYKTKRAWDKEDNKLLDALIVARKLLMLGWLNSRTDNPHIRKYLKTAVKRALAEIG